MNTKYSLMKKKQTNGPPRQDEKSISKTKILTRFELSMDV